MVKECMLSSGKLPLGGLPRNNVVRITDLPDMTSAVYSGRKATNQTNKQTKNRVNDIIRISFIYFQVHQ